MDTPKLGCPKLVYPYQKQSSSTPLPNYPKGEPVVYFEKMHVYVYKASYYDKGKMKDSKNFWEGIIVLGGRCPGVIWPRAQFSLEKIVRVQLSGGNFLGGNCPGVNCPVSVTYTISENGQAHAIKIWLQLLMKKHASWELLSFKNSVYKEKCETFTKRESVKVTYQEIFFWRKFKK